MPRFQRRTAPAPRDVGSSEPPDPYARGLALLSRREWSRRELRDRLLAYGCDPARVDTAVERLVANGTLDDARVARAYARTAARVKHRGRLRILRELATKGIADDVARAAVDEALPADEAETALHRELARRLRQPADEREVRRVFAALVRRGFAPADVGRALRRMPGAAADPEDLA